MNISELTSYKNNDKIIDLKGWVNTVRHHGGLLFFDLRDPDTTIQVVTDKPDDFSDIKNEFYISINGTLTKRDPENINKESTLGEYEIALESLTIISSSKTLPFQIEDNIDVDEVIRLKYRYLDLRRKNMKSNMRARSDTFKAIREYMNTSGINELDTPTLIKSTPEGAKDFIVPSRKSKGKFYALPQSPQMYKQLFMLSGMQNYYQIAKCYRDEDSRKDRQPEFTQLDIEMLNGNPESVQKLIEDTVKFVLKNVYQEKITEPFEKLSYDEAIDKYGTDKPDLRIKNTIENFTDIFVNTDVSFISKTLESGGHVKGFVLDKILTRSEIDALDVYVKELGSPGLGWFKIENSKVSGPLSKVITSEETKKITKFNNSTMLFQAGNNNEISPILDYLRTNLFNDKSEDGYKFVWIDDFPYFEYENGVLQPSHHPFTSPIDTDEFINNPESAKAHHYDLVLNGIELGSGSQRINDPYIQKEVLTKWGLSDEEISDRFGWFIEALSYGSPQHAGFAIGLDRFIAEMTSSSSIRDVIPFPKTQSGLDPLTDAPAEISPDELTDYGIILEVVDDE